MAQEETSYKKLEIALWKVVQEHPQTKHNEAKLFLLRRDAESCYLDHISSLPTLQNYSRLFLRNDSKTARTIGGILIEFWNLFLSRRIVGSENQKKHARKVKEAFLDFTPFLELILLWIQPRKPKQFASRSRKSKEYVDKIPKPLSRMQKDLMIIEQGLKDLGEYKTEPLSLRYVELRRSFKQFLETYREIEAIAKVTDRNEKELFKQIINRMGSKKNARMVLEDAHNLLNRTKKSSTPRTEPTHYEIRTLQPHTLPTFHRDHVGWLARFDTVTEHEALGTRGRKVKKKY